MDKFFTDRLVKIRQHFGLNQKEMGPKIGKSPGTWQPYEQGTRLPGGEIFAELCKIGININWLLIGEGEMMRQPLLEKQPAQIEQAFYNQLDSLLEDNEAQELMNMQPEQVLDLFNNYSQVNIAQFGWTQMEIIKRFPEFRRWLKKQKEMEQENSHIRQKIA